MNLEDKFREIRRKQLLQAIEDDLECRQKADEKTEDEVNRNVLIVSFVLAVLFLLLPPLLIK